MDKHDEQFESYLRQFRLRQPGPLPEMASMKRRSTAGWLLAAAAVVLAAGVSVVLVRNSGNGAGPKAIVESAGSPSLYRVGETIESGKVIRSNSAVGLLLALEDGSRVEMHAQSELKLESAGDGIRVRLNGGSIVVTAAKQGAGHLYVQTRDAMVSVVGTVFLVSAEQSGTTVAVVEGEVHVQQGAELKQLRPGEQVATNPSMQLKPVVEQISWSRSAVEYAALLQRSNETASAIPAATAATQTGPSAATPANQGQINLFDMLQQYNEAYGKNSLAPFRMAEALFEQGDFNYAVQLFRDSLEGDVNPKWIIVWAHINIGKIYDIRGGQRDRAVQEYQKAISTGDDTYSAQAEAKKYLGAPFSLSGPTQQAVAVPYPSLTPPALLAQQQAPISSVGKQVFERACTSCHSAEITMRLGAFGTQYLVSDRTRLTSKQAELAQLLKKGLRQQHPDVVIVQEEISVLLRFEAEIRNGYSNNVLRHLSGFGGTISGAELPALVEYALGETIRKAEIQGTSVPTPSNDKDGMKEDPEVAGARILNSACTTCHDLGPVTGRREDRASWQGIVEGMVGYGANVKDAEISVLVDYLFKHYGKQKKEPTPPEPAPSELPVRRP